MKSKLILISLLFSSLVIPFNVLSSVQDVVGSDPSVLNEVSDTGWGLFEFLVLIGSLGVFMFGMKLMSEGLQKATGSKLRHLLGSMTSNRFSGVLTGLGITSFTQSSTVTTVMTISFVNAGLLTLSQSAGVIMGANIGTTLTGWIINVFGFEVDIASYALVLIGIAAPLMFVNRPKVKALANIIIGFSLLFMGLGFLKGAVPVIGADSAIVNFFVYFKDLPFISTIVFVFFGTLLTVIVQSSSAALALTMTLVMGGVVPFEVGAAMILGENIGTTITAELAATVGNVHAKRAARIHTLFNVIGVTWMILLFPYVLKLIAYFMFVIGSGNPFDDPTGYANTGIVILHSFFNITNTLILIWFTPTLVRLAEKTVKSKGKEDEEYHLDFLGSEHMPTPNLSLLEAKKAIAKYGNVASRMNDFTQELLHTTNKKNQVKLVERIGKYEEITDRMEVEVANYLNKISASDPEKAIAVRIRGMNSIIINLERIGDLFFQIGKELEQVKEEKIPFSEIQVGRIDQMFILTEEAFMEMNSNLNKHSESVSLDKANEIEDKINQHRDKILEEYLDSLSTTEKEMRAGLIYNNLFTALERIADHIVNVSEGIVGKI